MLSKLIFIWHLTFKNKHESWNIKVISSVVENSHLKFGILSHPVSHYFPPFGFLEGDVDFSIIKHFEFE